MTERHAPAVRTVRVWDLTVRAAHWLHRHLGAIQMKPARFGIARLPRWLIASRLKSGELVLLMKGAEVETSEIHAVWPHSRYLPSKTRSAIDALVAEVPALLDPAPLTRNVLTS